MRIYKVSGDLDNFDVCGLDKEACRESFNLGHLEDWDLHIDFDGSSQEKDWWPRIMKRRNDKPLGDYVSILSGDVMIMERKAINKLRPLMGNVEILPLVCDFGDYLAINVMDVLECIDYEKSEFKLFKDEIWNGRPHIMRFIKYEFIKGKTEGYNIFKIIDAPKSRIFVNETFVEAVEKNGITGFKFELVWES